MTYDEWEEKYKPVKNHIVPTRSFQDESGTGIMFETFGPEKEFVQAQAPNKIWTLCEDDGVGYIASGWHFVNRLGYFVCAEPHEGEPLDIEVWNDTDDNDNESED